MFKDQGATVLAHEAGREYLQSDTAQLRLQATRESLAPWIDAKTRLVPADRWLRADEVLELGACACNCATSARRTRRKT